MSGNKKNETKVAKGKSVTSEEPLVPHESFSVQDLDGFGRNLLAPVVSEYLARLHSTLLAASAEGARVLFCYRAGLRILLLYKSWLAARGEPVPERAIAFKTSRIAALKAAYSNAPAISLTGIGMQLSHLDLHDVLNSLLDGKMSGIYQGERLHPMPLHEFMETSHVVAQKVRSNLVNQSNLMETYLDKLAKGATRLLLIDSGWSGTSQLALQQAFPDYAFEGVYFGTIGRTNILGLEPTRIHGLMFESPAAKYDPLVPESAILLHRHLIESLFEPAIPSITSLTAMDVQRSAELPSDAAILKASGKWDKVFSIVHDEVVKTARDSVTRRLLAHNAAVEKLGEMLIYPDSKSVCLAAGKFRSNDLGTSGGMAPLFNPLDRFANDTPALRIRDAIWPAGQAAMEYVDPVMRRDAQQRILAQQKINLGNSYFVAVTDIPADGKPGEPGEAVNPDSGPEAGAEPEPNSVAIITRTKNRPLLLRRAAQSVALQSRTDYEWVIVNDGGDLSEVLAVIDASLADPGKITVCHHPASLGMEAASNAGIAASASRWIVIHDDDDAWHPDFLKQTCAFLERNSAIYQGVITGTVYVSEEIVGQEVREHGRRPYQDWVQSVHLAEMATTNYFAPIAFLFSRAIYQAVDGFDPRLPVLGDWDFNLRFLLEADIGVIPEVLAYYHHRDAGSISDYSNSVVGGISKHIAYNAILRNKYVRKAASDPKMALLANLVNAGYLQMDNRNRLETIRTASSSGQAPAGHVQSSSSSKVFRENLDDRWILACAMATKLASLEGKPSHKVMEFWQEEMGHSLATIHLLPPSDFDEERYLEIYPDIARSVSEGNFRNGYSHYIVHGRSEGRQRPSRN